MINKYIEILRLSDKYIKAIELLDSRVITNQSKRITEQHITKLLRDAVNVELSLLSDNKIQVGQKLSASNGTANFKFILETASRTIRLDEVLSEGEQKIISFAGFIAESKLSGHKTPLILDDPVTSLDHNYKYRIAKRLISLGTERQIIIFTHDLPFIFQLHEASNPPFGIDPFGVSLIAKCPLDIKYVKRNSLYAGIYCNELPPYMLKSEDRLGKLLDFFNREIANKFENDKDQYNEQTFSLFSKIRSAIESMVEYVLFDGIVKRYAPEIQTQRLKRVVITPEDAHFIDVFMAKASEITDAHDKAKALGFSVPNPPEVRMFLKKLIDYCKTKKEEKNNAEKQFEELSKK